MYDQHIGITWKSGEDSPYISWFDKHKGTFRENRLRENKIQKIGRNSEQIIIPSGEARTVQFSAPGGISKGTIAWVHNPSTQLVQPKHLRELLISPAFPTGMRRVRLVHRYITTLELTRIFTLENSPRSQNPKPRTKCKF